MNDALVFFLKVKKTVPYESNVKMLDDAPRYYMKDCLAQMMEYLEPPYILLNESNSARTFY